MSLKGSITTANYIDFDKALNLGIKMIKERKDKNFGFYIIVAINSGLRIGDILELKRSDFVNGQKTFREQKTNKAKTLIFNESILKHFDLLDCKTAEVFTSNKGSVFSRQQINRKIKQYFKAKGKNFSSHSLRKSFGRRVYENNNQSEHALIKLSEAFNHSSIKITRAYLDITQEELNDIYINL
jgi:integrase